MGMGMEQELSKVEQRAKLHVLAKFVALLWSFCPMRASTLMPKPGFIDF